MVTYLPIASPFVRLAGFWVDDALSFAMGWNYFFLMGASLCLTCLVRRVLLLYDMMFSNQALAAFNIPYEITAISVLLTYWTDKVPAAAVVVACMAIYAFVLSYPVCSYFFMLTHAAYRVLNGLAVRWFGTSEFYMSIFKIFLMLGLMMYTFVTMVGGNPDHDAYGFRYWKNPVIFFL